MLKTGAELLLESLLKENVREIFGYPGGSVLPLFDTLIKYPKIKHILVRHEQGAAFAACGYARAGHRVGVCFATSGPGATNLVTGIADAHLDSVPLVLITGQVPSSYLGLDAFQEADIVGITMPITKHNYLLSSAEDIPRVIAEAFYIAKTGRPGPVLIDIPKDIFTQKADFELLKQNFSPRKTAKKIDCCDLEAAAELINAAKRPLIIAGHGVRISRAEDLLYKLAKKADILVAQTIHGLGSIDETDKLSLGMIGMHGHARSNFAASKADLILAVGTRLGDRVICNKDKFGLNSKIIHIDIEPAEVDKNVSSTLSLIGDTGDIFQKLLPLVKERKNPDWHTIIKKFNKNADLILNKRNIARSNNSLPFCSEIIAELRKITPKDALIVTDVGQNQMFTCQNFKFNPQNRILSSGGLGSMGFGLPAAIGAKVACPKKEVFCISGDGGFQMNLQELMTMVQENLKIKIFIFNNSFLGMVRQWQELFFSKNYAETKISSPKYNYIAKAYGLRYFCVKKKKEISKIIKEIAKCKESLIAEFFVSPEENVLPIVPAGKSLEDTIISP